MSNRLQTYKQQLSVYWIIGKRWLKWITVSILSLALLFIVFALVFSSYFEDKVKDFLLTEINTNIQTKVTFSSYELSLLKSFPYASFQFNDVVVYEKTKKDTPGKLINAKQVFFSFSLYDIIKKKYKIRRITIKDGDMHVAYFKDGSDNFTIWKESNSAEPFLLELNKVQLYRVNLFYDDHESDIYFNGFIDETYLKGDFSADEFDLVTEGDVYTYYFKVDTIDYLPGKEVAFDMSLLVDNRKNNYTFSPSECVINDVSLAMTGKVTHRKDKKRVNLVVEMENNRVNALIDVLPHYVQSYLSPWGIDGEIALSTRIKGSYLDNDIPFVEVFFDLNNTKLEWVAKNLMINDYTGKGYYSNGVNKSIETSVVKLSEVSFNYLDGHVEGDLLLENFKTPHIKLNSVAHMYLYDLNEWFKIDSLASINGQMSIEGAYEHTFQKLENITIRDIAQGNFSGKMSLSDVNFYWFNDNKRYNDFNGQVVFNNKDLDITQLEGFISKSHLRWSGKLLNAIPYILLQNEPITIQGSIQSSQIELSELLRDDSQSKAKKDTIYNFHIPKQVSATISYEIDKLRFNTFSAKHINGTIQISQGEIKVPQVKLNTLQGDVVLSGALHTTPSNKIVLSCNGLVKGLDVTEMFDVFHNFYQESILGENLKGKLSSAFRFSGEWSTAFDVDMDKIYALADIEIQQGQLLHYKPVEELSSFIKAGDLSTISFATLKNRIEIKNKVVTIPEMEVNSSAINLVISGKQTFDEEIDYKIRVLLSEVLGKRAKASKKENELYGVEEDDGLGRTTLYLLATGTLDNPIFSYDFKGVGEKIKTEAKEEKQEVKRILKEEFGLFKKDSLVAPKVIENKPNYKVIWDEEE